MNEENLPIWKFDKVEITQIRPFFRDDEKSHVKCYVTIDFGFFKMNDFSIIKFKENILSWIQNFAGSQFELMNNHVDNTYGKEVRKLESMIKNEIIHRENEIIAFLKDSSTKPVSFTLVPNK